MPLIRRSSHQYKTGYQMKTTKIPYYSEPCKKFRKKKSLAFYILIIDPDSQELKHREMLRIVNKSENEFYVFPVNALSSKQDLHFSYHKSGRFHWTYNRQHYPLLYDERDFREAFQNYIKIQSMTGWIKGYCVACGPETSKESLRQMLELLSRYGPIDFRSEEAVNDILSKGRTTQWNPYPLLFKHSLPGPLAFGFMLAELKNAPGKIHTLNFFVVEDEQIKLVRIEEKKWARFAPFKRMKINIKEFDSDSILTAHVVFA